MASSSVSKPSPDRIAELKESLAEIRARVQQANTSPHTPTLVAVSKYKPAADILACYEDEQRDFGENYVQELEEKAEQLNLPGIRWHFIGTFQSNKAKTLASVPNLYSVQTVTSTKGATGLNRYLSDERPPLNVLLQINTSGEDNKSGVPPLDPNAESNASAELTKIATFITRSCPRLHLQGLMTIGSLTESLASAEKPNHDFETLIQTRDLLQAELLKEFPEESGPQWGIERRLVVSMGMSSDFEAALKAGSDIIRVGTGIFGSRPKKEEVPPSS